MYKTKETKQTEMIQNGIQWRKRTKWKPNDRNVSSSSPPHSAGSGVAVVIVAVRLLHPSAATLW